MAAVIQLGAIGGDYWRYMQISRPDVAARAGVRVTTVPSPTQDHAKRDALFARAALSSLDEINVEALPQPSYVTWLSLRWEMEALTGWPAFHRTRLWDLSPGRSVFEDAIDILGLQQITDPGSGKRFIGLLNSVRDMTLRMRSEFEERAQRDIRLPRGAMDRTIAHVRGLIAPPGASPFGLPSGFQVSPDSTWQVQLARDVSSAITDRVNPALDSLVSLLERERERSTETIGMSALPGGAAHYAALLRYYSTLELRPAEAHAIGLREVARVAALAVAARQVAGLPVSRDSLRAMLLTDSRFVLRDPDSIPELSSAIYARLAKELDSLFQPMPTTVLSVGVQRESDASSPLAIYLGPITVRPTAAYLINPLKLATRSLTALPSLIARDLMPGLHHQRATQFENTSLSPVSRQFHHEGFVRGWQLYALHVADSLSQSFTPAQRFSVKVQELAAACGLVIDTGINALGWSHEDALGFLRSYLPWDDADLEQEFIIPAIESPGMVGAGALGVRELRGLRQWAMTELGPRFSLAAFHQELLRTGSVPLPVLGSHLERWIWEIRNPELALPPGGARR